MRRTSVERCDRRMARAVAGVVLVMLALALGGVGSSTALAQDTPDPDLQDEDAPDASDPADDPADEGEPITIEASTLFVSPVTDALPPTLTDSVPPAALCVLQPDLCPESSEPLRNLVVETFGQVQDNAVDSPVQPVPPDTAAVSYVGGTTRYQTALVFDAPEVPEGDDVLRYELTFAQAQPTYDLSSPAFRRVVLGLFEAIAAREPGALVGGLTAALEEDPIDTSKSLAFEACPLLAPVEPGGAPMASDDTELPHHEDDGETVVAVDCTYGGNGVYDEDADVWRVDLAFTAQAWADGELDNHGVLLRPIGAPNLAFGDADTSTIAQLVLDLTDVTAAIETAEPFEPGGLEELPPEAPAPPVEPEPTESFADEPVFTTDDDLGAPLGAPEFPADGGDLPLAADAPDVAGDLAADPEATLETQAARPAGSSPSTPWWVWLVAPLLLGGAYLTGSAVLAPAPVVATGGGGALTRLLARNRVVGAGPTQI